MVKIYARSAYLFCILSIITSAINASSLSPQKLSQKLYSLDPDFFRITGLAAKIKENDNHQTLTAKINFAQIIYNMQQANQNRSCDPVQLQEKRTQAILELILKK